MSNYLSTLPFLISSASMLALSYFKKRNYLNGFINYLKELESQNILNIII